MSKKKGLGKFLVGVGAGVGLGMLFAPDKGEATRRKLKVKIEELLAKAKEIDIEEVKEDITCRIEEIKEELETLNKEKVIKIAKEKSKELLEKVDDLLQVAKEKATPVVEEAVEEVREKAVEVTKSVLAKLEKEEDKK